MIEARFTASRGKLCGFSVSGHSGYDSEGADIVCASVSSAVMLICNALTEVFGVKAKVEQKENLITCKVPEEDAAQKLLEALRLHLELLAEDYPENVTVKISEV